MQVWLETAEAFSANDVSPPEPLHARTVTIVVVIG